MKVSIKDLGIPLDVKNRGIEFEVRDPNGTHRGDLILTGTQLIWCKGRTSRANGVSVSWDKFVTWMQS